MVFERQVLHRISCVNVYLFTRRKKVTSKLAHDHVPESLIGNEDADADADADELMVVNSLSSQYSALSLGLVTRC